MTSPAPALDAAGEQAGPVGIQLAGIPPLSFDVPEGFHALPLADTREERAARAAEFARQLFPKGNEELWNATAQFYALVALLMSGGGLAYAAMGLFGVEDGVAHCAFNVAAVRSEHTSTEVAAQGIRAILADDPANDVRWIDLPCGPAISCVTLREVTFKAQITESGEDVSFLTGQIQVHVPFPTGPYTAVFTFDTSALKDFGDFCDIAAAIVRTVSFPDPESAEGAE